MSTSGVIYQSLDNTQTENLGLSPSAITYNINSKGPVFINNGNGTSNVTETNSLVVDLRSLETIINNMPESLQKNQAKSLVSKILEHPMTQAIANGAASGIASAITGSQIPTT